MTGLCFDHVDSFALIVAVGKIPHPSQAVILLIYPDLFILLRRSLCEKI